MHSWIAIPNKTLVYNEFFNLIYLDLEVRFFFIIINMGVRVSLSAPQLIPRALKLTTM